MSGIRLPDNCKFAKNWKKRQWCQNFLTWPHHQFFLSWPSFFVIFSYWSRFHVNIMTGSGVMTIFVCKGLTRNPKTGNTPIWVLPNTWGELEIPNLARMFVIKCYWMLQITSVATFIVSEVLRENQQGDKLPPLPTQIRVKIAIKLIFFLFLSWK